MKTVTRRVPETVCEQYCVPGRTTRHRVNDYTCCFDPCTCQTVSRRCGSHWECCKEPDQVRTRQKTCYHTVCEQVPCTTYVKECHVERVPVGAAKISVSRRSLFHMIGTLAGSSVMYSAMTQMGLAQESGYAGPPKLSAPRAGTSVLILGAGIAGMAAAM